MTEPAPPTKMAVVILNHMVMYSVCVKNAPEQNCKKSHSKHAEAQCANVPLWRKRLFAKRQDHILNQNASPGMKMSCIATPTPL